MMLSVIWEGARMGFLEGTEAKTSPEGIVSLCWGFAGESCQGAMGWAGGHGSARVPALLGKTFVEGKISSRLGKTAMRTQACDGEVSGYPDVPRAELCHQGTAFLGL